MGRNSREKWIKRAMAYENIVVTNGPTASKKYLDRFKDNLQKFMKGASELEDERADGEEEDASEQKGSGHQG